MSLEILKSMEQPAVKIHTATAPVAAASLVGASLPGVIAGELSETGREADLAR